MSLLSLLKKPLYLNQTPIFIIRSKNSQQFYSFKKLKHLYGTFYLTKKGIFSFKFLGYYGKISRTPIYFIDVILPKNYLIRMWGNN